MRHAGTQLDLLDRMYFQFIFEFDSYPEAVYSNTYICPEYSFLTTCKLDEYTHEQVFIFSDGLNSLRGVLE